MQHFNRVSSAPQVTRRMPIGAEPLEGGTRFRVWASKRRTVAVLLEHTGEAVPLEAEPSGYFSGIVRAAEPGSLYWFRLDDEDQLLPDPASRFQPQGPHGPSQIVDPGSFEWHDAGWRGVTLRGQVIYELHVGTFTPEGTWDAAARELPELARAGITLIEMMPVAEYPGRFGWGYDGVDLYAPSHLYGSPDDLRRFVDRAHAAGLGVILDVVYNHVGPDGSYLKKFSDGYFTARYKNDWGEALNFDGPDAGPVREFFVSNAAYWISEFHFDGLRLDATQDIHDRSRTHLLVELGAAARTAAAGREILLIAENEPQETRLVRRHDQGGYGLDALWNDDYHHTGIVALTGRREAYYSDYGGTPQEFISLVKRGYLYQGQWYGWQKKRRGTPSDGVRPEAFVTYLENHDQVANSADGRRLHQLASPARLRALTALLLLGPGTPMLFQGQEFAASAPFLFFADHVPELAESVARGRKAFLSQFPSTAAIQERLPPPHAESTFERCKLDVGERVRHAHWYSLHTDLLRLRKMDPVFSAQGDASVDGALLSDAAFILRWSTPAGDRLLLVNLGVDLQLGHAPEPLLAPPAELEWQQLWASEEPQYGGRGTPAIDPSAAGLVPGESAVVFASHPRGPKD